MCSFVTIRLEYVKQSNGGIVGRCFDIPIVKLYGPRVMGRDPCNVVVNGQFIILKIKRSSCYVFTVIGIIWLWLFIFISHI